MTHALTIEGLDATPVLVPLAQPLRTASGIIAQAPLVLVDLRTTQGITGRAYLFAYTPLVLRATVDLLAALAEPIRGQACAPSALKSMLEARFRLLGHTGLVGMALAGIDMAAWDALARAADMPLARLLGAEAKPVQAYFSQGLDGAQRGMELAEEALARGFRAMKIKAGYASVDEDVAVIRAVQSVLGKSAQLMVDYNQSLTVPEALVRCRALDELGLAWIEEPVRQDDYAGAALVAQQIATPVQVGENWFGLAEMAASVRVRGSDLVMPDAMKIGGVTGWLAAASLAQAHGLPMSTHLFHEVSVHLMAVTPTAHWVEYMNLADPVLAQPMRFVDGMAMPLDGPGNGIEWDAPAVARYRAA